MLKKFLKQMPSIVSAEGDQPDCDPNLMSLGGEGKKKTAMVSMQHNALSSSAVEMRNNPGEVAFFRLLNSELKKAIHFFDKVSKVVVAQPPTVGLLIHSLRLNLSTRSERPESGRELT